MTTMTTKELIARHNAVARDLGRPELTGWKQSKEALLERLEALRAAQVTTDPLALTEADKPTVTFKKEEVDPLALTDLDKPTVTFEAEVNANQGADQEPLGEPEPDAVSPTGAEDTTDEPVEPEEHRGGIGQMVRDLLLDAEGYDYQEIVDIVRGQFPQAKTSRRSIASVAAALRRKNVEVPMRRKAGKTT